MSRQLRANLPISIFISPHLPFDEDNNLVDRSTQSAQRAAFDLAQQAPPVYGEHMFDQLYSELDPNGYQTPPIPGSGGDTPHGPHSRNMSMENLATMLDEQDLSASALHNRLNNLHHSRNISSAPSTPPPELSNNPDDIRASSSSRRTSLTAPECSSPLVMAHGVNDADSPDVLSRHASDEENFPSGVGTPRAQYHEIEDLCRVPSYSTAVRSSTRTQYDTELPNYQSATAGDRPASSSRYPRLPSVPGTHTASSPARSSQPQPRRRSSSSSPRSSSSATGASRPFDFHHRHHSYNQEHGTDNWLRIMQARARS